MGSSMYDRDPWFFPPHPLALPSPDFSPPLPYADYPSPQEEECEMRYGYSAERPRHERRRRPTAGEVPLDFPERWHYSYPPPPPPRISSLPLPLFPHRGRWGCGWGPLMPMPLPMPAFPRMHTRTHGAFGPSTSPYRHGPDFRFGSFDRSRRETGNGGYGYGERDRDTDTFSAIAHFEYLTDPLFGPDGMLSSLSRRGFGDGDRDGDRDGGRYGHGRGCRGGCREGRGRVETVIDVEEVEDSEGGSECEGGEGNEGEGDRAELEEGMATGLGKAGVKKEAEVKMEDDSDDYNEDRGPEVSIKEAENWDGNKEEDEAESIEEIHIDIPRPDNLHTRPKEELPDNLPPPELDNPYDPPTGSHRPPFPYDGPPSAWTHRASELNGRTAGTGIPHIGSRSLYYDSGALPSGPICREYAQSFGVRGPPPPIPHLPPLEHESSGVPRWDPFAMSDSELGPEMEMSERAHRFNGSAFSGVGAEREVPDMRRRVDEDGNRRHKDDTWDFRRPAPRLHAQTNSVSGGAYGEIPRGGFTLPIPLLGHSHSGTQEWVCRHRHSDRPQVWNRQPDETNDRMGREDRDNWSNGIPVPVHTNGEEWIDRRGNLAAMGSAPGNDERGCYRRCFREGDILGARMC